MHNAEGARTAFQYGSSFLRTENQDSESSECV